MNPSVEATPLPGNAFPFYKYEAALIDVLDEIRRARATHAPMRGAHEGYAVLLEEVDELWREVKDRRRDIGKMHSEAVQVAAMAVAFMVEVCAIEYVVTENSDEPQR